jgi:Flp pilus assembly protein TadD
VLLVASTTALDDRLGNVERHWLRPGVAADLAEAGALEPFALWSLFVGGTSELSTYAAGAGILSDNRMTLEFSTPREIHRRDAGQNADRLAALADVRRAPAVIQHARQSATAEQWRNRGAMMAKRDAHATAYDDYTRALTLDPDSAEALEGFVRTAILTRRSADALTWIKSSAVGSRRSAEVLIATSKLLAARGSAAEAIDAALQATAIEPVRPEAFEQLGQLYADAGDTAQLERSVSALRNMAPLRAGTHYYAAVAAFLRGDAAEAIRLCERATAIDPAYAPVYDLMGAAYTKLGDAAAARSAFQTSLRFDAHDSTAYTNLGLLELAAGNHEAARRYFAEALWLEPNSIAAREGLRQTIQNR